MLRICLSDHQTEVEDCDGYTFTTCASGRRLGKNAVVKCQEGFASRVAEVRRDDVRVFGDDYGRGAGKPKRKCLTRRKGDGAKKRRSAVVE